MSIIPQSPFLFSGSLRDNLDVSGKYTDAEIFRVIHCCGLSPLVSRLGNLDSEVGEKGSSLSMGERQLICLARALLIGANVIFFIFYIILKLATFFNVQVVCIDEATAHVDSETDMQIQKTLRESFPTATVLTIAHRINTIVDYDMVLVMEKGKLVEYDTPQKLLQDDSTRFSSLAKNV